MSLKSWERAVPAAQSVMTQVGKGVVSAKDTIKNTDYKAHATNTVQYTKDHPFWTLGMALSLVPIVAPAAVGGGLLGVAGFSAAGPVSGSLAASAQAAANPVVAGGAFATLQSAAMGGYGAATVFGAVQGAATAAHAACYARFLPWGKKAATVDEASTDGEEKVSDTNTINNLSSVGEENGDDGDNSKVQDQHPLYRA